MELPKTFLDFASLYARNGFSLYMIGGTSRDYLLGLPVNDFDFVTDATPEEEKAFLTDARFAFAKFGSVHINAKPLHVDVTTLRAEEGYDDHRHPKTIRFIKDLREDSLRRDFTINAIYIDASGKIYDFHDGLADLEKGIVRFIGDPRVRIKEDPLRILRAERFAKRLGFRIEENSQAAMDELWGELDFLNPEKVLMESKKS
jgi:tRNA nucleotidyltransferase/poly(A) polymerase